jgi:hypothetical protein
MESPLKPLAKPPYAPQSECRRTGREAASLLAGASPHNLLGFISFAWGGRRSPRDWRADMSVELSSVEWKNNEEPAKPLLRGDGGNRNGRYWKRGSLMGLGRYEACGLKCPPCSCCPSSLFIINCVEDVRAEKLRITDGSEPHSCSRDQWQSFMIAKLRG